MGISEGKNRLTAVTLRVLDALLVRNPERTATGLTFGLSIQGLFELLKPILIQSGFNLGPFDWWASISLGIALVNIPSILWSVSHKPLVSDEVENIIELIETTNLGEIEKRIAYRRLVNKCIDQFTLSGKPGKIADTLAAETEDIRNQAE